MTKPIRSFSGRYAFLSNFAPSPLEYEGIKYPTVEHAFQAAKTLDNGQRLTIASARTPGIAKRAGRRLKLRDDWDVIRIGVMFHLLLLKFAVAPLSDQLLKTGDAHLVEGNTWGDRFWGVCGGKGENHLGALLMQVRDGLRATR
jgi:ribA/ribD-fused uncharacterized protein